VPHTRRMIRVMPRSGLTRTAIVVTVLLGLQFSLRVPMSARQKGDSSSEQGPQKTNPQQPQGPSIEYKNAQYGFCFSLPKSWKGYSIVTDRWKGNPISDAPQGDEASPTGPIISIRHPQWTSADPRQDIPIMVFTIARWNALEKDKFSVSAAPIGPGELGRNRKYVFALPPRFDWAFPTGYEEVEQIVASKSLHTECKGR
jgi:hypothetical protein